MLGTRYVEHRGTWVPDYTVGDGLGTRIARGLWRLGFKQTPGCGCASRQRRLDGPRRALPVISGGSGGCTVGTDCYCDCAKVATGTFKNSSCQTKNIPGDATALLMCEDFEAPTLYNNQGLGQGAPYFGPWYDDTGLTNDRGHNSYWNQTYHNGVSGVIWFSGDPGSPAFGPVCGFSNCTGLKVWDAANRWGANNYGPVAAIPRFASDFTGDGVTPPSGGQATGVFDGTANFGHRIVAGGIGGITGNKGWTSQRTVGVTMAQAYSSNIGSSNIWRAPWKSNEWDSPGNPGNGLLTFHNTFALNSQVPFENFIFWTAGGFGNETNAGCNARVAAATKTTGDFSCNPDTAFYYRAGNQYIQSRDWPFGTWGCVQGYFESMGLTTTRIRVWFTGPSGIQIPVIDISNFDTSHMSVVGGLTGYTFDSYANTNDPLGGGTVPTTSTVYRWEDNIHIRAGAPVPCSQIGFATSSGGDTTPPTLSITAPTTGATYITRVTPL